MKALRRLVKVIFIVLAGWILLPVLVAYNDVILLWFNFLVEDSLVDRLTFDAVEALHAEVFEPIVVPRVSLFVFLVILTWFLLRRTRPSASPS